MIQFNWYNFTDLSLNQLYEILVHRSEVFVVDQNCTYLDPDGNDFRAIHLLGIENGALQAYLRLFPPSENQPALIFGRVLTSRISRSKGYGKQLLAELIKYCRTNYPGVDISCSAQHHLKHFYGSFGFQSVGNIYDDEGIPHIDMVLKG